MRTRRTGLATRGLKCLLRDGAIGGSPDEKLLNLFLTRRGESAEAAFAVLVERHGPMVLGVCRRVLSDPRDVEDAFQATFLILARKAGSVRVGDSLGRWLYGVSRRVASRARVSVGRRLFHERELASVGDGPAIDEPSGERLELRSLLDEELGRLPAKYRDPLVLCYLQGQTHEAAARELGWPVGTVRGRLARARDLIRTRLIRRGLAPSLAILGASAEARAAVPPVLVDCTAKGACLVLAGSGRVATWVGWELGSMTMARWRLMAGIFLAVGATSLGMALGAGSPPAKPQGPKPELKAVAAPRDDQKDFVGTWTSLDEITETVAGVPRPSRLAKTTWVITADKIAMSDEQGFLRREIRYSIDSTRTPKTIDLRYLDSGGTVLGLYQIVEDELTLCFGFNRPIELAERPGVVFSKLKRESRKVEPLVSRFELAPGCLWAVEPGGAIPASLGTTVGLHAMVERPADGSLVIILAQMRKTGPDPGPTLRPVVFDARGKRHLLKEMEGGSTSGIAVPGAMLHHVKYRLDPAELPAGQAATLGIEAVPEEAQAAPEE